MYTELHILKTYVDQLLADPVTYNKTAVLKEVAAECERLKNFLFFVFNKTGNISRLSDILNWYQYAFIRLADSLFTQSSINDLINVQAMMLLVDLSRHTEIEYGRLLNGDIALSIYEARELKNSINHKLEGVGEALKQKGITPLLVEQLLKAHADFFRLKKYPKLSYLNKWYLEIFIVQLKALAFDEQKKDWNSRLRQLLIKYNFNHMGVFKFLKVENGTAIDKIKDLKKRLVLMYKIELNLFDIEVKPNLAYSPEVSDLKSMLLEHFNRYKGIVKEEIEQKTLFNNLKFHHTHNVNWLILDFHYSYGADEFAYKSKLEAAEAYCRNNRSKDNNDISPHSMAKFDKDDLRDHAKSAYNAKKRKLEKMAKDFGFE